MAAYKTTCLAQIEKEYGAKTAPECGWSLAKNFPGGASAEEKHTLEHCSVFDRCHTMRIRITGKDVLAKLSGVTGFEVVPELAVIRGEFSGDGFTLLSMAEDDVLLLAGDRSTVDTLSKELADLEFTDLSEVLAQLDIAGAELESVLGDFDIQPEEIPDENSIVRRAVAEVNSIMVRNTALPVPCVTLIFTSEYAEGMWEEFVETFPVKPAGFAAWNALVKKAEQGSDTE